MAKQTIITIKNWFKTGLKPTQAQFWDLFESYWHKDEQIPIAKIDGVEAIYTAVNNISASVGFISFGAFQIFKNSANNNPANKYILEINDVGAGFIDAVTFMPFGIYLGGDPYIIDSWNTSPIDLTPIGGGGGGPGDGGGEGEPI